MHEIGDASRELYVKLVAYVWLRARRQPSPPTHAMNNFANFSGIARMRIKWSATHHVYTCVLARNQCLPMAPRYRYRWSGPRRTIYSEDEYRSRLYLGEPKAESKENPRERRLAFQCDSAVVYPTLHRRYRCLFYIWNSNGSVSSAKFEINRSRKAKQTAQSKKKHHRR